MHYAQARNVIAKFGGARRLAKAINRNPAAVYKWDYPRERGGTAGLIPTSAMNDVLAAADVFGINLTADDLDPTRTVEVAA